MKPVAISARPEKLPEGFQTVLFASIAWVGPPPTNSGILGICKYSNVITITS